MIQKKVLRVTSLPCVFVANASPIFVPSPVDMVKFIRSLADLNASWRFCEGTGFVAAIASMALLPNMVMRS
jgi:hypothetical protein